MGVLDRFRLDGDTAIVTGGNRGIGYAIARGYAEVGANVVIANRDSESGEKAADNIATETGAKTLAVPTNVRNFDEVQELVEGTVDQFGSVDILVNNAGIALPTPAEEKSMEEWERTIDINLTGAFRCAKAAGEFMIENRGGSIINISSMSAFIANYPQEHADYQASKSGLEGMKTNLASEWAEFGIRVNNINPGYVLTDILKQQFETQPELEELWLEEMLFDELAAPEDITPLAIYLASDASSYVTGTSVLIDGGYTVR